MTRIWTIIGVADVHGSCAWYQSLLDFTQTTPVHHHFGQILDPEGTVLLCLHEWGAHEHPSLTSPDRAQPGNGLLLFFRIAYWLLGGWAVDFHTGRVTRNPILGQPAMNVDFRASRSTCT